MREAVAFAYVVDPVMAGAGEDVALEFSGGEIPVLVFTAEFDGVERAVLFTKDGEVAGHDPEFLKPETVEVGHFCDFDVIHNSLLRDFFAFPCVREGT